MPGRKEKHGPEAYGVGGLTDKILEDPHWDDLSLHGDSFLPLGAPDEASAAMALGRAVKVKKEGDRVFPIDDPFGFFQVEREVTEELRSKKPQTTPVKQPAKSKKASPSAAPNVETPGKRRSSRQALKPSSSTQNKPLAKRLPTISEKTSSKVKREPKSVVAQKRDVQRKAPKRKAADDEVRLSI